MTKPRQRKVGLPVGPCRMLDTEPTARLNVCPWLAADVGLLFGVLLVLTRAQAAWKVGRPLLVDGGCLAVPSPGAGLKLSVGVREPGAGKTHVRVRERV